MLCIYITQRTKVWKNSKVHSVAQRKQDKCKAGQSAVYDTLKKQNGGQERVGIPLTDRFFIRKQVQENGFSDI